MFIVTDYLSTIINVIWLQIDMVNQCSQKQTISIACHLHYPKKRSTESENLPVQFLQLVSSSISQLQPMGGFLSPSLS